MSNGGEICGAMVDGIPLKRVDGLILIMDTPKGRGVFAAKDLPAKTVLEVSPVLVLDPVENEDYIKKTQLYNYTYNWPYSPPGLSNGKTNGSKQPQSTTQAVILGLGSMFNHSNLQQNVGWERDVNNLLITYTALRDIRRGEELCISYGPRLTFKDTDPNPDEMTDEDWGQVLNMIDLI